MSTDVTFFETNPFSLSTITSQGVDDDLLVYTVFLLALTLAPSSVFIAPALVPIRPPIT